MKTKNSTYSALYVVHVMCKFVYQYAHDNQPISPKISHVSHDSCSHDVIHIHVPIWYGLAIYHTMYYIFWEGMVWAYIPGN
jgi:hypothetical protein